MRCVDDKLLFPGEVYELKIHPIIHHSPQWGTLHAPNNSFFILNDLPKASKIGSQNQRRVEEIRSPSAMTVSKAQSEQ